VSIAWREGRLRDGTYELTGGATPDPLRRRLLANDRSSQAHPSIHLSFRLVTGTRVVRYLLTPEHEHAAQAWRSQLLSTTKRSTYIHISSRAQLFAPLNPFNISNSYMCSCLSSSSVMSAPLAALSSTNTLERARSPPKSPKPPKPLGTALRKFVT
jgi:hypothetical protein